MKSLSSFLKPSSPVPILVVVFLTFSSRGMAGILVDPYAGYYLGNWMQGSRSAEVSMHAFGARFGYQDLEWSGGIDLMTGAGSDKGSPQKEVTSSDAGVFVSYSVPLLFRIYAEYGLLTKATYKSSSSEDGLEGTSMKLGLGWFFYDFLTLNLEYYVATFDKDSGHKLSSNVEQETYGLSISLPFDFENL